MGLACHPECETTRGCWFRPRARRPGFVPAFWAQLERLPTGWGGWIFALASGGSTLVCGCPPRDSALDLREERRLPLLGTPPSAKSPASRPLSVNKGRHRPRLPTGCRLPPQLTARPGLLANLARAHIAAIGRFQGRIWCLGPCPPRDDRFGLAAGSSGGPPAWLAAGPSSQTGFHPIERAIHRSLRPRCRPSCLRPVL